MTDQSTDDTTTTESDSTNEREDGSESSTEPYVSMDPPTTTLSDIAGLEEHRETLRTTVVEPLSRPSRTVATHSVLITGDVGSGKTYTARALLGTLAAEGVSLGTVETLQSLQRDPDELTVIVDEAIEAQPAAVYLGEINDLHHDSFHQHLREEVDRLRANEHSVVFVASINVEGPTHHMSKLLEAFQVRTDLDNPSVERRQELLQGFFCDTVQGTPVCPAISTIDFESAAQRLNEHTVTHLRDVCDRSIHLAHRGSSGIRPTLTDDTFQAAATAVASEMVDAPRVNEPDGGPGVCRIDTDPQVGFDDIGGLDDIKRRIQESFVLPSEYPEVYSEFDVSPVQGILLYGPPGNGKTMLARAIASESDRAFFSVKGPELKDPFSGNTEEAIRDVFAAAKAQAPSVVFLDEVDSLGVNRDRTGSNTHLADHVNALLAELDGVSKDRDSEVVVIGATNRKSAIDDALLRPGRLGTHIEVPKPDAAGVKAILRTVCEDIPMATDVTTDWIHSELPSRPSGAQIATVCERAVQCALSDIVRSVDDSTDASTVTPKEITVQRRHVEMAIDRLSLEEESEQDSDQVGGFA